MAVVAVEPVLFSDHEAVTYRCKECRSEVKRTFKRSEPAEVRS
jgi:hypothetical protein